jgi:uncharacterized membrane protein
MVWRGNVGGIDRLWGCLPYALPMAQVVGLGFFLFNQVPPLLYVFKPVMDLSAILSYQIVPGLIDLDLVVFFLLYIFVVRNGRLHHFVRFNTMQSLLLSIGLYLLLLVLRLLTPVFGAVPDSALLFLVQVLASTLFIGMNGACLYGVFQSARGVYAELPIVSEAAYYQVRF